MNEDKIRDVLERIGVALSTSNLQALSNCWEVPALVLSDEGAIAVTEVSEIEKFFAQATEWYHSQGIRSTKAELERVEALSESLAAVDVRWPSFDASGAEKYSEHSHYIIQVGNDGQARIRVALTRTM